MDILSFLSSPAPWSFPSTWDGRTATAAPWATLPFSGDELAALYLAGAGLGASAQAATITRGFVELRRIGTALGGRPETMMGLSGLGDLILTCGSPQSRNFSYGVALGKVVSLENLPLAEGAATAGIAARIAREKGIDAPICDAVTAILDKRLTITQAMAALLARPLKTEDH